ncbi:unnamed protein product [Auanema sp. JU1783]|nr:unnamed protein product [Auanema sp. JU1783]
MSASLQICAIPSELKERLKEFRFSKSQVMNALIVKIDKESQQMVLEEHLEDCELDDITNELPQQQPRYLLLSFARKHSDGRVSYPMCLIFYSPPGCSPDQQMLYAGSRNTLVQECELTKNFEIRDIEELTQEYIDSKI